jgi:hypothetical protein
MFMKKDILVFFAAIVIFGSTFAGYLNWLLIQPKPGEAQMKVLPPKSPPAPVGGATTSESSAVA